MTVVSAEFFSLYILISYTSLYNHKLHDCSLKLCTQLGLAGVVLSAVGLGELCLKFLYYAMPAIPGNVILMKLYYAHIMLNCVIGFYL